MAIITARFSIFQLSVGGVAQLLVSRHRIHFILIFRVVLHFKINNALYRHEIIR
jgi:hypothetical protein